MMQRKILVFKFLEFRIDNLGNVYYGTIYNHVNKEFFITFKSIKPILFFNQYLFSIAGSSIT